MKTKLFLLAAAAVALASCSNDEVVEVNQGEAISFRPFVTNVTRAAEASFVNGTSFKVTAFEAGGTSNAYFNNVVFTATEGTTFTSTNKYYWPSGYNLDFYAWAPSSYSAGSGNYTSFEITPGTTISSQPDFVYAVTKGWGKETRSGKNGVAINFRHAESKILINLKNTNPNLKVTVGDVKIGNLRGTETFTWNQSTDGTNNAANTDDNTTGSGDHIYYLDGNWTATSAQNSVYTVAMGTDDIDAADGDQPRNVFVGEVGSGRDLTSTPANHEMILIPQALNLQTVYSGATAADPSTHTGGSNFAGAYITVQIKIQNTANDAYIVGAAGSYVTALWPLATVATWLPGHKYTYTIDLAGGGYWDNNQDTDLDLDPILEGAEIKFVTVTVDNWLSDGTETVSVTNLP